MEHRFFLAEKFLLNGKGQTEPTDNNKVNAVFNITTNQKTKFLSNLFGADII